MARKKRTAVTKPCEQLNSLFFKLPSELRNRIYGLVFEHDDKPVNVEDAFSPSSEILSSAAPPSSALLCACRKLHHESKGFHTVAYRNYWRKDFVVDLRRVDALRQYIEHVPTAWIDAYIMKVESEGIADFEVLLSRCGGRWHVKAVKCDPWHLTNSITTHTWTCLEKCPWDPSFPQGNMVSDDWFETMFGIRCTPQKRRSILAKARLVDRNQSSRSRKSSKPKYKRPHRPTRVQVCHRTNPKVGPLNEDKRRDILKNRMHLPKAMAPLTKSELLRIMQPRMGLTWEQSPDFLKQQAYTWEQYMIPYFWDGWSQ